MRIIATLPAPKEPHVDYELPPAVEKFRLVFLLCSRMINILCCNTTDGKVCELHTISLAMP